MRRLRILMAWLIGTLIAAPAFAQVAVPPPTPGTLQIGVAAAVQGAVQVATPGAVGRIAESGLPIYLGDVVTTDAQGRLQILLLDETVFTIGPNSAIAIDEFVYDPATQAGKVGARVVKGVFRFVTGKIAHHNPSSMEVKLPVGVIGIRGTIAAGRVEGERAQVVLLGPGARNNTGDPAGSITVGNEAGGTLQQVALTRPGFGTTIPGQGQPPTPPALVPVAELDALTGALTATAPGEGEGGEEPSEASEGSATEQAGQATAEGLESLMDLESLTELAQDLTEDTTQTAQDTAKQSSAVADGIATKEQLRTIETGVFNYTYHGPSGSFVQTKYLGSPSSYNGTVNLHLNIDFGARTIGGPIGSSTSHVIVSTLVGGGNISRDETIEAQSFATGIGNATFGDTSSDGFLSGSMTLVNSGGVVAAIGRLNTLTYDDGSNVGSCPGSVDVARQSGPSE